MASPTGTRVLLLFVTVAVLVALGRKLFGV